MISRRRTSSGRRSATVAGTVAVATVAALLFGTTPALAAPQQQPPTDERGAAAQLEKVQEEAEQLTEEWHNAKDNLEARQKEVKDLEAAVAPTRAAADAAKAAEEQYRVQVDALTMTTFESGNLDQLNALLEAGSPQDFLDQMSALETLAIDHKEALDKLLAVVDDTKRKQGEADAAVSRAQAATNEAQKAEDEIEARKKDAEKRIGEAERLLDQLTPAERRQRRGPDLKFTGPITGSGAGVQAIKAAQSQLGKPYKYGAEGPGSYDCSGLTSWAFRQAGVTLPRSSKQQAAVGRAVTRDQLQAGDLVFFYQPISHVGIYVGDGMMINAPQTGDVVKYQSIASRKLTAARRL